MPNFVLNRNYALRSLMGHIIDFKKGEPTYVPHICAKEAVAIGAECVDEKVDVLGPEEEPVVPLTPGEREQALIAAFRLLEERNGRSDFDASGAPSMKAVEKIVDFEVNKAELNALWVGYRAEAGQ